MEIDPTISYKIETVSPFDGGRYMTAGRTIDVHMESTIKDIIIVVVKVLVILLILLLIARFISSNQPQVLLISYNKTRVIVMELDPTISYKIEAASRASPCEGGRYMTAGRTIDVHMESTLGNGGAWKFVPAAFGSNTSFRIQVMDGTNRYLYNGGGELQMSTGSGSEWQLVQHPITATAWTINVVGGYPPGSITRNSCGLSPGDLVVNNNVGNVNWRGGWTITPTETPPPPLPPTVATIIVPPPTAQSSGTSSSGKKMNIWIIVGICVGVLFLIIVALIIYFRMTSVPANSLPPAGQALAETTSEPAALPDTSVHVASETPDTVNWINT